MMRTLGYSGCATVLLFASLGCGDSSGDDGGRGGSVATGGVGGNGGEDAISAGTGGVSNNGSGGAAGGSAEGPFTFLAYGDSRGGNGCDGNAIHRRLVGAMAEEPADFVFHLGDMVTGYDSSTNWVNRGDCPSDDAPGSLRELIAPLQGKTPAPGLPTFFFPVVGNHDDGWNDGWYPDAFGDGFCDVFDPTVWVPNHTQNPEYFLDFSHPNIAHHSDVDFKALLCSTTSSAVYPGYVYHSFDYANSHFVVLRVNSDYFDLLENCPDPVADADNYDKCYNKHQLDWLQWDLAKATANAATKHVFVLTHAPLVTTSWGHAATTSSPVLLREFSRNGKVKVALSGHNHVYERSVPIYADDRTALANDPVKGTVYTVTGGGGSAFHGFNPEDASPFVPVAMTAYHYLRFDVDDEKVHVRAIDVDGAIIDEYDR